MSEMKSAKDSLSPCVRLFNDMLLNDKRRDRFERVTNLSSSGFGAANGQAVVAGQRIICE
jgi:hypothetical protein